MNQNDALKVLVQAVQIAQTKGAFSLVEAKVVAEAVEVFVKPVEKPTEPVDEAPKE